ncbi:MAG: hypothetical protein HY401_06335 [Elusimicrobia bacterium]|nr:hypothetical protein [Elusimicrobiota bacterium]
MIEHFLISGTPGVGKTTLLREAVLPYKEQVGGFLTLETRGEGGRRLGFEVLRLQDGARRTLASKEMAGAVKLDKYGLDIPAFEEVAVAGVASAREDRKIKLIVIDEIGAMEAESASFRRLALECLRDLSKPVLATIRSKNQPFAGEIKKLAYLRTVELTRQNYPRVKTELQKWLSQIFR